MKKLIIIAAVLFATNLYAADKKISGVVEDFYGPTELGDCVTKIKPDCAAESEEILTSCSYKKKLRMKSKVEIVYTENDYKNYLKSVKPIK